MFGHTLGHTDRKWNKSGKSTAEMIADGTMSGHDQTSNAEKELQADALNTIISILLSSGYFRARIGSLSNFDKVVGGLCWCITNSGADLDVDILFRENSTIGERVKLSEKIVHALRAMKCPHALQANQIQGSDWAHVQPVIVWLIKKFFENREQTQKQLRLFAEMQFGKHYTLPQEERADEQENQLTQEVLQKYRAERRFRLDKGAEGVRRNTEESRVHSVLLEYGETLRARYGLEGSSSSSGEGGDEKTDASAASGASSSVPVDSMVAASASLSMLKKKDTKELNAFERKLAKAQEEAIFAEQALAAEMEKQEGDLLQNMETLNQNSHNANAKNVGNIVGMSTNEIAKASAKYQEDVEEAKRKIEESASTMGGGGTSFGQLAAFKRQKAALERQIETIEPRRKELAETHEREKQAMDTVTTEVETMEQGLETTAAEVAKLTEMESQSDMKNELAKLKRLVMLNEQLRAQETSFKASCKRQLTQLNEQIAALKESADEADADSERLREIEDMHGKVNAKYDRLRQLLAERNLTISSNMRMIDDIPTRTELIQYERRFTELYQQVAVKLGENKKYFETYNTLEETLNMMKKEVNLINSITDNFDAAMKTKATKEQFLSQFQNIIKGVQSSLEVQQRNRDAKSMRLESLTANYQNLVDEQRRYFKAVKDFQEECNKNELYSARLAQLQ